MANTSEQLVSAVSITVAGGELPPEVRSKIIEVRVKHTMALPSSAVVRITDSAHTLVDDAKYQPGAEVEISMGAPSDTTASPKVFKGEIVAMEPEFTERGVVLTLRCLDKSHRLQRARKVRTYQDVSVSDIVQKLTSENGLNGEVSYSGSGRYEFFQQNGETAREVIARLERDHDCRFWLEDGSYRFKTTENAVGETVEVTYPKELLNLRPRLTSVQQAKEVQVMGWDPKAKKEISGSAGSAKTTSAAGIGLSKLQSAFTTDKVVLPDRHVATSGEANELASSALNRRADAHFEAEGRCIGNPRIKAGTKLKIAGVGTAFSGTYVVSQAEHVYRGTKGYTTNFVISGRSARGLLDLVHPPKQREWAAHMVVGLVTNVNDPDKMARVKVKYPTLPATDGGTALESTWARVVTVAASKERGVLMLPEVNDEVVVAFENGDPRRPLVVGAVFNGKDTPGADLSQNQDGSWAMVSNKKAFMKTKEDMTFKSDKKLVIEVTEDSTHKAKNVSSESSQEVKMKAGTKYTMEAGSSLSIKGATISVEAQGSLELKGASVKIQAQGMLDLQASGVANLKGSMVNIG